MKVVISFFLFAFCLVTLNDANSESLVPTSHKVFTRELVNANLNFSLSKKRVLTSEVKTSQTHCLLAKEIRSLGLPKWNDPNRDKLMEPFRYHEYSCYQDILVDFESKELEGIVFKNFISPKINPHGHYKQLTSYRSFTFNIHGRFSQSLSLDILDNPQTTLDPKTKRPNASGNEMYSEIIFIPRTVYPYITKVDSNGCNHTKIRLPTDETVIFNSVTKEILSGVLKEAPIDMNSNRHERKFAQIEYTGKGLTIRVDRRAGVPRRIHSQSFNKNENTTKAIITYKDKECLVPKEKLWENIKGKQTNSYFKFPDDQDLLDTVINPICGWNIELEDLM
jgi:hypothetical protein